MGTRIIESNQLLLTGVIATPFSFSHESHGEKFYIAYVSIMRFSGNQDLIPVMVSEHLVDTTKDLIGAWARIEGCYRSQNLKVNGKTKLSLYAFARTFDVSGNFDKDDENDIYLEGFVCKLPSYRTTPLGREITDVVLAVNRPYGKTDYIPCIFWGRNAKFVSTCEVGAKLIVYGRIQSREYVKHIEGEVEPEIRTAYEVSASKVERGC